MSPFFMISGMCRPCPVNNAKSARGPLSTTTRSAKAPGATVPMRPSMRHKRAATPVAEAITTWGQHASTDHELFRLMPVHLAQKVAAVGHRQPGVVHDAQRLQAGAAHAVDLAHRLGADAQGFALSDSLSWVANVGTATNHAVRG